MTQYIAVNVGNPKRYSLLKEPDKITLMNLIQLFHGDICIGESYDHYLARGHESIPTQSYVLFRRYEKQLYQQLYDQISKMAITDFRKEQQTQIAAQTVIPNTDRMLMVGNGEG